MCIKNITKRHKMANNQIWQWAHMLDESRHASYYEVYMQEHPEDKLPKLIDSLIGEFAESLKKDGIKLSHCIRKGFVNVVYLDDLCKQLKTKYYWHKIKAQTYAAIISRITAVYVKSKGQRFNEADEISFDDVSRGVSRKVVEDCLDIVCHNTNVLEANNYIVNSLDRLKSIKNHEQLSTGMQNVVNAAFKKYGFQKFLRHDSWTGTDVEDYFAPLQLYKCWGSYAKGTAGEEWICDSDNEPAQLKKVLDSVEYSADTLDLVVTLNKAVDVVHFRSDLANAFLEGGQRTASLVSNLPDKFII